MRSFAPVRSARGRSLAASIAFTAGALGLIGCAEPTITTAGASPQAIRASAQAIPASVQQIDVHGPFVGTGQPARGRRIGFRAGAAPRQPAVMAPGQPGVLTSFEIDPGMGARDPVVAAGHDRLIVTTTGKIAIYGKEGALLQMMSTREFFAPLRDDCNAAAKLGEHAKQYPIESFYDTRVIFDEFRNRFWIGALARNEATRNRTDRDGSFRRSKFVVAVSKTEDPQGEWWLYWWDAVIHDGACFAPDARVRTFQCPGSEFKPGQRADYPAIGVSPELFVEANFSDGSAILNVARADDLANGTVRRGGPEGITGWHLWNFKNPSGKLCTGILQPAVHHGRRQGDFAFLTSAEPDSTLVVWAVAAPAGAAAPLLFQKAVGVERFAKPVAAPQPPTAEMPRPPLLDIGLMGAQVMKTAYRDGSLYATWHDCTKYAGAARCATSIRLARVDVSAFPESARATIDRTFGGREASDLPTSTAYYGWPVVEVNRNGDMVLGYNRAGESVLPEARYAVHRARGNEVLGFLLRAGESPIGGAGDDVDDDENKTVVGRIDNSGIAVDPSDDTTVWVIQPYGARGRSGGEWRLVVGRVSP